MADILSRRTALQVKQAEEADRLSPGTELQSTRSAAAARS